MNIAKNIVSGVMIALFLLGAYVQLNDPDPELWITIYVGSALLTGWFIARKGFRASLSAVIAVIALSGAAYLSTKVLGKQPLYDSEEGREMMGLALIGVWFSVLAVWARGTPRQKVEDEL